jgi:group I intron endonuclease
MVSVYWIHHPEHTDMFTQGYIGVSKDLKKRWNDHAKRTGNLHLKRAIKKYGWDNLVKEVVLVAEETYCLMIEAKLRTEDKIGWNIIKGGGMPPSSLGMKFTRSEEYKQKQSFAKKGKPSWNKGIKYTKEQKAKVFKLSEYMKDKPHGMLGKTLPLESIESMRQKKIGKKQTVESIEKRRKTMIGYVYTKTTCPKCNKSISINMAKRFHFNNCKGINPFQARTTFNGKRIFIGNFATKELANLAIENYKKENS